MDTLEQLVGGEGRRVTLEEAQELIKAGGFVYFGNRLCPFAHRSFWAAEELGFAANWTYVHIDLGARKPAWYSQINPLGTVPCLYFGGKPVFESLIVSEYINDVQKGSLLPADPLSKAAVRFVIARFDDTVKAALYSTLMNKDPEKTEELANGLHDKLAAFDAVYKKNQTGDGPFLLGDQLSLAEIAIFPFIERFETTLKTYRDIDLFAGGKHPTLKAAADAIRARPAFRKTTATKEFFNSAYAGYGGSFLPITRKTPTAASALILVAALVFSPLFLSAASVQK